MPKRLKEHAEPPPDPFGHHITADGTRLRPLRDRDSLRFPRPLPRPLEDAPDTGESESE